MSPNIRDSSIRRSLITSGVLVEGTGERLGRTTRRVSERWRLDEAAHASAALEIWCCERGRVVALLGADRARVSPVLRAELGRLADRAYSGTPVIFVPREQWLRDAMAPETDPLGLAS